MRDRDLKATLETRAVTDEHLVERSRPVNLHHVSFLICELSPVFSYFQENIPKCRVVGE